VSHSTPEAEIVAADYAIRQEGLPALSLWDVLAPGHAPMVFQEDNEAMIKVCKSGKNPTMRGLLRTHGVSVAFLKETFDRGDVDLRYVQSSRQAADIYTKGFTNSDAWNLVTTLIGIYDPKVFVLSENIKFWATEPPKKGGGANLEATAAMSASPPSTDGGISVGLPLKGVSSAEGTPSVTKVCPVKDVSNVKCGFDIPDTTRRIIIEICCERNSIIGQRAPNGCLVIRITEEDNILKDETMKRVGATI